MLSFRRKEGVEIDPNLTKDVSLLATFLKSLQTTEKVGMVKGSINEKIKEISSVGSIFDLFLMKMKNLRFGVS